MGGDSFQVDVWVIYMLSDVCAIASDTPWLEKSLSAAEGMASDVSRFDKSILVGDTIKDDPWLGKSAFDVGDKDDTRGSGNSLSDATEMGSSTSWPGGSLSDDGDMDGDTLGLDDSLSVDGGNSEETPWLLISVSDDGGIVIGIPYLDKSLHCCATVLTRVKNCTPAFPAKKRETDVRK